MGTCRHTSRVGLTVFISTCAVLSICLLPAGQASRVAELSPKPDSVDDDYFNNSLASGSLNNGVDGNTLAAADTPVSGDGPVTADAPVMGAAPEDEAPAQQSANQELATSERQKVESAADCATW